LHCPEMASTGVLTQCCTALHMHWCRSVSVNEQSAYAKHVCSKFSRAAHHQVSNIAPPQLPPSSFPCLAWTSHCSVQDEIEDAVCIANQSPTLDKTSISHAISDQGDELHRLVRCPRCSRTWQWIDPQGLNCPDCGVPSEKLDDWQWVAAIAARSRCPAGSSWKHPVGRQNWVGNRFRRAPEREQLLWDLGRASRGRSEKVKKVAGQRSTSLCGQRSSARTCMTTRSP